MADFEPVHFNSLRFFLFGPLKKPVQKRIKNFIFYWLPLSVYCLLIYIQSDYPSPKNLPSFAFMDKILHFVAYGVMGVLFYRAYQTLRLENRRHILILLSVVSASVYGISDEIHQYFIPLRNADLLDIVADILGAVCGVYVYQRWANPKHPSSKPH